MWQQLLLNIKLGDVKSLARAISLVENEFADYLTFLQKLPPSQTPVIGITGPPGAGKSTLVDALIAEMIEQKKKIAVLCVDPSSPFNLGALLGDRIRLSQWYQHPLVYIRSLATRGSLGGLHPKIMEITDVLKAAAFDYIIIETVGVGQSEVEIAGLADTTVVVLVPEAGDEVQTMKAGLMEVADIFVVNKSDRPAADAFVHNLKQMLTPTYKANTYKVPVLKTVALKRVGAKDLLLAINQHEKHNTTNNKKNWLLAEKAFYIIQQYRMRHISKQQLKMEIDRQNAVPGSFNLYSFVQQYVLK